MNLRIEFDGSQTPVKTALFMIVCAAWMLPGLVGHEPWKPDEALTFGFVYHILKTGDWIVPMLAGEVYFDKPPLYPVTAALFARLFSAWLPLHDGARLATGLFMSIALLFAALTGRRLYGPRHGRMTVLILIGCLGLLVRAHEMIPDVAQFAGFAVGFYGLVTARQRPWLGGLALGTGAGIGFLAKGWFAPVTLGASALLLPLLLREWRNSAHLKGLMVALLAALPWLVLWPYALYLRSPALFAGWWLSNGWGQWADLLAVPRGTWYYLENLPWYAWPALPLALWTLWQGGRKGLLRLEIRLTLLVLLVALLYLSLSADARDVYGLPLLLPLSLIAVPGIDALRRGAASAFDWFGLMTFGLFSALLWLGWLAMLTGWPPELARWLADYQPELTMEFRAGAVGLALALTLIWLATVLRTRQSSRRAVVNWTAGITMFWMLAMTLWLPLIDEARSYRAMFASMQQALPAGYSCLASRGLGEPQRALLDYYAGINPQRTERFAGAQCELLLAQGQAGSEPEMPSEWHKIWEGRRPGDKVERFRLYQKKSPHNSSKRVSLVWTRYLFL